MGSLSQDAKIARSVKLKPITDVAESLKIPLDFVELYGKYKAKINLGALAKLQDRPPGHYVAVTAITPTPLGEGKTVTTIGLSLGLNKLGHHAACTIRQPSLGPIFGIKGGATGGGRSQVLPMEEINLHLTGDIHAVSSAHNLLSAIIDNHLYHGNKLSIDPTRVFWKRVIDMNDRALRSVTVSAESAKLARPDGFDIAVASEVMAILALSTSYEDMRKRLGKIIVGVSSSGEPVTSEDLHCAGAMASLLKDALKPNLLQTSENTPAFIHTGPFGNTAHGNSSIIADQIALKTCNFVVTECGFGADLGFEKFIDIKCRTSGLAPSAAVIVTTVRALKMHSGRFKIQPGKPLPKELFEPNEGAVLEGGGNLEQMISIVKLTGTPALVAINMFDGDSDSEINLLKKLARDYGADGVAISTPFSNGSEGTVELAREVAKNAVHRSEPRYIYDINDEIYDKIERLARKCYGADSVEYSPEAEAQIFQLTQWGYGKLPVCMAKTHLSLSHDPQLKGRPKNYVFKIKEVRVAAGAGFIYPMAGEIMTMPGLPAKPAAEEMEINERGELKVD
jgi:formate--tetrahydrofolate ligase